MQINVYAQRVCNSWIIVTVQGGANTVFRVRVSVCDNVELAQGGRGRIHAHNVTKNQRMKRSRRTQRVNVTITQ